jgi:hypothetical protein
VNTGRRTTISGKVLENRMDLASAEMRDAILKFCDWAENSLPMPVHPAVGRLMLIGRELNAVPRHANSCSNQNAIHPWGAYMDAETCGCQSHSQTSTTP